MNLSDLWPPQQAAITAALAAMRGGRRSGLIVLPTGAGKTKVALTLARLLSLPTCFLVHRDYLAAQTVEEAMLTWPEAAVGIIQGERDEWRACLAGKAPDLVVASVASLHQGRLTAIPPDRFGLLISDEAHRSVARRWSAIVEHFRPGFHLGLTATPDRLDRVGLAKHFGEHPLCVYQVRQAIEDGVLVPPRQYALTTGVDLDKVKASLKGVWDEADLSEKLRVQPRSRQIVEKYMEVAGKRRAVCFAVDLAHVAALVREFSDAGVPAIAVSGQDRRRAQEDERQRKLAAFKRGEYRVLVNCEVATEGFNDRGVSCIIFARPTKSRSFYQQALGRGLRQCPEEGKVDCIVIDAVDVTRQHKLVTCCELLGLRDVDARGQRVLDLVKEAERKKPARTPELFPVSWRLEEVSPWPDLPSLDGYVARSLWQRAPATERQLKVLHAMGLSRERPLTKGEASHLIDQARMYEAVFPTPATGAQERWLRRAGAWKEGLSKREASRRIGELKEQEAGGPMGGRNGQEETIA